MKELILKDELSMEKEKQKDERLTIGVKEAAEILGIGRNNLYAMMQCDGFPKIKVGKNYRIIKSRLTWWLENNIGKSF